MTEVFLNAMGMVCALGRNSGAVRAALFSGQLAGVAPTDQYSPGRSLHLGRVHGALPALDRAPITQRSRSNALFAAALADMRDPADQAIARWGPARVAVVLGVSAAGLGEGKHAASELAAGRDWPRGFDYGQQEMGGASAWLAGELGISGPAYVISTACSSGAKALASSARLLRSGRVDAVIAGGGDALSSFTIAGFSALESVSAARCNPLSVNRNGINIGEGAALFVMSRQPGPVRLAGWGESSDAHHMSAPDPQGRGAAAAMLQALARAGVAADAVDYCNLHGTATVHNDSMESLAVAQVLGLEVPVSSTKPLTGHTLAAAGAVEAALAWHALVGNPGGSLPPHWWDGERDDSLARLRLAQPGEALGRQARYILSNSFAFGGSNASLVFAQG